jgi:non-ribosomal peptide synthetase component F
VPRESAVDGFRLAESIRRNHPTHIQATPSTFQLLLESGWENKEGVNILMGGEAIRDDIKEKLLSTGKYGTDTVRLKQPFIPL